MIILKALKIIISAALVLCVPLCLISCSGSGRVTFENAMSALSEQDFSRLETFTTSSSSETAELIAKYCGSLDENYSAVYKKLMSYLKYSYSEDSSDTDGVTLHVKLTHVDLVLLSSDVAAEISVSGSSASDVIDTVISSGRISEYIVSDTISIAMKYENGKLLLPLNSSENGELMTSLGTVNFLRWFSARQG